MCVHEFVKIPVFLKNVVFTIYPFSFTFGVIFLSDSTYYREYRGQAKNGQKVCNLQHTHTHTQTPKIARASRASYATCGCINAPAPLSCFEVTSI
jgi:hypothetical protein